MRFGIAGAGFSGAVIARELAEAGHEIQVFDTRDHVAGNCHTERDEKTGVLLHVYGAHIFHTADERAWAYLNRFGTMHPYNHRVRTTVKDRVYLMPVNLLTINQLFGKAMSPKEAMAFVAERADSSIEEPANFEEQALKMVGPEIYEAFFYGYTRKQWGMEPTELPASILKRLPLRFTYDDGYFSHPYQGMPEGGYTPFVENMLDHDAIDVSLSSALDPQNRDEFDHVIWTGPVDAWFDYEYGRLGYRTLDFERFHDTGDYQGCSVMNYGDIDVPYTRIHEHKLFSPWEEHDDTVLYREYSRAAEIDDIPYYPIRLSTDQALLRKYLDAARLERGVSFVGRLGTYRYLDMDVTIGEALGAADAIKAELSTGNPIQPFFVDPS